MATYNREIQEKIMKDIRIKNPEKVYFQYMVDDKDLIEFIDNRNKYETYDKNNLVQNFDNFYELCGINREVVENKMFVLKICENMDTSECIISEEALVSAGQSFQIECVLIGGEQNRAFPKCVSSNIHLNGRDFTIITGSKQKIRRVNG